MLNNYLILAFRNLFRHKTFSIVNIGGLALGMAASILLLRYVAHELSYDQFHGNLENIYRVRLDIYKKGVLETTEVLTYHGAAPAIKEDFEEVATFVRLHRADGMVNYYNQNGEVISHHETKAFYADSTFFSVFSFPLLRGNASKVLRSPASVVISASAAKKYFGMENPIGKTLSLSTEWKGGEYVIDGIFKDIPGNSHIQFDFVFSIQNLLTNEQFKNGAWYWTNFYTYLVLAPGTDPLAFEQKLSSVIDAHLGRELKNENSQEKFILQPLKDIHLHSSFEGEWDVNGNYGIVSLLSVIAFFIVAIAWLNYINLSTAKATERAREVGVRKVLGSKRNQLISQFLLESFILAMLAVIVAIVLLIVVTPKFNELLAQEISFDFSGQATFWVSVAGIIAMGTLISGLYPAFVLSSFNPLIALKGKFIRGAANGQFRRVMIVFQFCASLLLIVATFTIYRQLEFMRGQDLGIVINQRVVLNAPQIIAGGSYLNEMDYFKNRLKAIPEVASATASSEVPGKQIWWNNEFILKGESDDARKVVRVLAVDEDFVPTYGLKILSGKNFSKEKSSDYGEAIIINETALKYFGLKNAEEAIGQEIFGDVGLKRIIGVVKDFHQQSLSQSIDPTMLQYIPWRQTYLTLSLNSTNLRQTMAAIENTYRKSFPENAFEYFFLDDRFDQQYASDDRSWKIFILFAGLSIVVACMGLFGLSLFMTIQRSKEVAIRKIVGASVLSITALLSKDFVKLVLFSIALSTPLAWLLMDEWLQTFAYRISIPWWTFATSGALVIAIAILTVGFQSIKAASANPVECIKNE